ncbi:MAG: diaminopimelate epimerase [Chitinivibrionales bacterium]|nr:diaminopimelate epimerase [Chitinivibrionales bacterium]MBD3357142.1 diaminopimelate epimerase [Chitinivibrionales bacterium]
MKFTKMEALANDFIMIAPADELEADRLGARAALLCDRRRGIGADGIIFVLPPRSEKADFRMRIINADGSEAEMCGNGIRCFAKFVNEANISDRHELAIDTGAGLIRTGRNDTEVRVDMGPPILEAARIPTTETADRILDHPLEVEEQTYRVTAVSMGNPHAVIHVPKITDELVLVEGPKLERHPFFPNHANIEFIEVLDRSHIRMRVYERGCGETAACGTGACAAVVAGVLTGRNDVMVTVHLNGGDLSVEWDGDPAHSVFMTGPARTVFTGRIDLDR